MICRFLRFLIKESGKLHCVTQVLIWAFYFQERKKAVKEARREKRENKTPKHVKKRKEKVAKTKKK